MLEQNDIEKLFNQLLVAFIRFSLALHTVEHDDLRAKLRCNMPAPLPIILLGRLAVSKHYQRHGLGESLLYEAIRIAKIAAKSIGVVALVVYPLSEEAAAFYCKHGGSLTKTEKTCYFLDCSKRSDAILIYFNS